MNKYKTCQHNWKQLSEFESLCVKCEMIKSQDSNRTKYTSKEGKVRIYKRGE